MTVGVPGLGVGCRWVVGCVVVVVCVVVSGCSGVWRGDASPSPSPVPGSGPAVVGAVAPPGPEGYTCSGLPDAAFTAMFGPEATAMATNSNIEGSNCWVEVPNSDFSSMVFYSRFGYLSSEYSPWDDPMLAIGNSLSSFSFPDVDGVGNAKIGVGENAPYGTTVFVCGEHYLSLSIKKFSAVRGDVRDNLVNLTESSLPWLCQDQPIPGLGQTMEQVRPRWATAPPTAIPTPP